MKLPSQPVEADIRLVRKWFSRLANHVQAIDYEGARPLFAADMIAFGTFTDFMFDRDSAERQQWPNVCRTIRNFRWRLDQVQAIVAADRLMAVGIGGFQSHGFRGDGTKFDRKGRATVSYARAKVGDPWIATHNHMSLFRGTPDRSHGKFR